MRRLVHDATNSPESLVIGGPIQENKEKTKKANPINYITKDDLPFLIMHGDKDPLVPLGHSELIYEELKANGYEVTMYKVKDAGYGFPGFHHQYLLDIVHEFLTSI